MKKVDLNCDMGESFGPWKMGDDAGVMPFITSANVACGAHAGDPDVMLATVRLALQHGVNIGAHPGYPDLRGFGRRPIKLSREEVRALLLSQIGALYGVLRGLRAEMSHIKPHGAFYHQACGEPELAAWVVEAVSSFSRELPLFGLPGSHLEAAAEEEGIPYMREGFADRAYEPTGSIRDRRLPGALFVDPSQAADNALSLANGSVTAYEGTVLDLQVDTLCVHGDTPGAARILEAVRRTLEEAGFQVGAK